MSGESLTSWRICVPHTPAEGGRVWFEGWGSGDEATEADWTPHRSRAEIFYDWPTVKRTAERLARHRVLAGFRTKVRGRIQIMRCTTTRKAKW